MCFDPICQSLLKYTSIGNLFHKMEKPKWFFLFGFSLMFAAVFLNIVEATDYYYPPQLELSPDDSFSGEEKYMAGKFFARGYLDPEFCQSAKIAAQHLKLHGTCSTDARFLRSWAMVEGLSSKLQVMKLWLISQNVTIPEPPRERWELPYEKENRHKLWFTTWCWMKESRFDFIQQIPVIATISLNLLFLINIVRVLVLKLRSGPASDSGGASRSTLQALRATLLLVPLLGLNFLLTPFRPEEGNSWEHAYDVISAVTSSFQGLCVAILFCFCNGEVQAQIKRKWRTVMFRPRANSCTVTTVSYLPVHSKAYQDTACT